MGQRIKYIPARNSEHEKKENGEKRQTKIEGRYKL